MTDIAIRVENLSKLYTIGRAQQRHDTLRDALVNALPRIGRISRKSNSSNSSNSWQKEETNLWALKDVSFEVQRGEVVGIIGRNGAGKSTLLKILSRITEPTSGRAEIHGRVGSLLEVGTGFHPELTGRENIYLNGAILGMRRAEIERKFDEIVAFAEIERFLDTPVKRYSSGMYVRLAFAVAAHLEPEILLVDEVLAVGDAQFQNKCLGKMRDVAKEGRTVLFVSHNTSAIQRLCAKSMLLDKGKRLMWGRTNEVLVEYLSGHTETIAPGRWLTLESQDRQLKQAYFTALRYNSNIEDTGGHAFVDGPLDISVRVSSDLNREVGSMAITFYDEHGTKLVNCDTIALGAPVQLRARQNEFTIRIAQLHLNPGVYTLGLWLASQHSALDWTDNAARLEVLDSPWTVGSARPPFDGAVSCSYELMSDVAKAGS